MSVTHVCDACHRKIAEGKAIMLTATRIRFLHDEQPQPLGHPAAWSPLATATYHVHETCLTGEKLDKLELPPDPDAEPAAAASLDSTTA